MKLSMQEHANTPGAVSMPGSASASAGGSNGSGMTGGRPASSQDIASLVSMGFTAAQAQDALARHNFNVHLAANYLLGGS